MGNKVLGVGARHSASALIGYAPALVQAAAEQIREAYLHFILSRPDVRLAISRQPAGTSATKTRWFAFKAEVQKLLNDIQVEPRFFDLAFRQQLYKQSHLCAICATRSTLLTTAP